MGSVSKEFAGRDLIWPIRDFVPVDSAWFLHRKGKGQIHLPNATRGILKMENSARINKVIKKAISHLNEPNIMLVILATSGLRDEGQTSPGLDFQLVHGINFENGRARLLT